jgi:hypothetical protein
MFKKNALTIAGAKENAKCPKDKRSNRKAIDYIGEQIQLMEALLFQQSPEYQRIVELEHDYSRLESEIVKAASKREKKQSELSEKRQKKSHESSKDIKECDSSLMDTSNDKIESVLSDVKRRNHSIAYEINEMNKYFDSIEGTLNQLISPDEEKPEELSSKERLSSYIYCGSAMILSNISINTPFGTVNLNAPGPPTTFSIVLPDKIEIRNCSIGCYSIIIKCPDDLSCFKVILISHKASDNKIVFVLKSTSPKQESSTQIKTSSHADAYSEYMNNRRVQQIDSLKSVIVVMEGIYFE